MRPKITLVIDTTVLSLTEGIAKRRGVGTSRLVESVLIHFLRFEAQRVNCGVEKGPEIVLRGLPAALELDDSAPSLFAGALARRKQQPA